MKLLLAVVITLFLPLFTSCAEEETQVVDIHPAFSLSLDGLAQILEDIPGSAKAKVLERPQYFLELVHSVIQDERGLSVLVDKGHRLEETYEPDDLVPLDSYDLLVSRRGLHLRQILMPDALAMVEAARAEGLKLVFSSTYRSYAYQEKVYARNVSELGKEAADRESAQAGASQHQLGTTMDFGSITDAFASTPEGIWLANHAWEYGFSMSYPPGAEENTGYRYESWHFRYIGRTASTLEQEFFGGSQQDLLVFLDENALHLRGLLK